MVGMLGCGAVVVEGCVGAVAVVVQCGAVVGSKLTATGVWTASAVGAVLELLHVCGGVVLVNLLVGFELWLVLPLPRCAWAG